MSLNEAKDIVSDSLVRNYSNHEKLVAQSIEDAENMTAFVSGLAIKVSGENIQDID